MSNNLSEIYLKFRPILFFLFLVEVISFACYFHPEINLITFFIVCFFTLILSLEKLEYGVYILLAELFIGSKGYLFSLELGGLSFSIRMALFLIVIAVWLLRFLEDWFKNYQQKKKFFSLPEDFLIIRKSNLFKWYIFLFIFIIWGLVYGFFRGNEFSNLFFDFNAWLYFALVVVFFDVIARKEQIKKILIVLFASITLLTIRAIVILFVFSHQFQSLVMTLYRWMADFRIGEIAPAGFGFYRIFFQSQIYSLIAFFIILSLLIFKKFLSVPQIPSPTRSGTKTQNLKSEFRPLLIFFILSGLSILISFSRSYWVGLLVGLSIFFYVLKSFFKVPGKKIFGVLGFLILTGIIEIGIVYLVINLPLKQGARIDFASLIEERITKQEIASQGRMNLLPPLLIATTEHPVLGSGFGTTVTYKRPTPSQFSITNPEGWYTAYAFEWGYLDIILKMGLAGLIVYLILIWKIWQKGWRLINFQFLIPNRSRGQVSNFQSNPKSQIPNPKTQNLSHGLILGLLLGLVALLVTNIFSPYLNHPLGIGYIMLCSVIFSVLEKDNNL